MRRSKYTKNDAYWETPNIENCYFAGFIAADGNISNDGNVLRIKLTESDVSVLNSLKKAIEYSGEVGYSVTKPYTYKHNNKSGVAVGYTTHGKNACYLYISSAQRYVSDLNKWYNITPKKSLTLQPPNISNLECIKAFIVGYFDGDGSIYWSGRYNQLEIGIVGTLELLSWIKGYLTELTSEHFSLIADKRRINTWLLRKNGSGVYKFLNALLDIDVPRLERKWNIEEIKRKGLERAALKAA